MGREGRIMTWLYPAVGMQAQGANRSSDVFRQGVAVGRTALEADMTNLPIRSRNGRERPIIVRQFGCPCYAC